VERREGANPQTEWQVGGDAAELYERYHVPAIVGPWAADLVGLSPPRSGDRVLDVACGTGVVARLVAQHAAAPAKVVGLDLNARMIAVARSLPPGPGAPVEWQEGSALAMPFADGSFDLVLCQQGLQFFPDRPTALREMHRVLVPGGRMALSVWRPIQFKPFHAALADALTRHVGPQAAAPLHAACSLGNAEELLALVTGAGFRDVAIRPATKIHRVGPPDEFVRGWLAGSPMAEAVARADDGTRAALVRDVTGALLPYIHAGDLAFPMEAHIAMARAPAGAA